MKVMRMFLKKVVLACSLMIFAVAPTVAHAKWKVEDSILEVATVANAPGGAFEGAFDTLIAALSSAEPKVPLVLGLPGKYTVFAPTDEAFEELGLNPQNVGSALNKKDLTKILLYHVAYRKLEAADVIAKNRIRMLKGGYLDVILDGDNVFLQDNLGREAQIIVTNVPADNGIIHAINKVVLPFAP